MLGRLVRRAAGRGRGRLHLSSGVWFHLILHRIRALLARKLRARRSPRSSWQLADGEAVRLIDAALDAAAAQSAPHEVLVVVRDQPITRAAMARLREGAWLNDELVNGYLGLVAERCAARGDARGRVHVMSTFFYHKLAAGASYNYEGVSRWTREVELRACALVLFPINLGNAHWIVVALDVRKRHFDVWDSLHGRHHACARMLRRYIIDEWLQKYGERTAAAEWTCVPRDDAPRQHNGFDCGVFVCAVARCLALGVPIDVSQDAMADIRRRIVFELMRRRLKLRACENGAAVVGGHAAT
ncbi:hypothetical protein KFE25_007530 [Diacronema lutheri]|uniref:Ubiquitin-like protease family profile domain-containing protein n=1 Tax=Diacronema lutheri TaxID=2081491 RepID=A0A8J6CBQ1_DIALT|nr:hypothetical protein KFE25_007530 [Diacronema lutheri]